MDNSEDTTMQGCHNVTWGCRKIYRKGGEIITIKIQRIVGMPDRKPDLCTPSFRQRMSTDIVANPEPQDLESTWASWNPTKPVIIPHTLVNKKCTHTEQITAHTKKVLNQKKAEALQQAIKACLAVREAKIKHLAKRPRQETRLYQASAQSWHKLHLTPKAIVL